MISAATRLFALFGDPVAHSRSPAMQNAAFRAAKVDAAYLAVRCDRADLPGLLRGVACAGGGGNVTVPHKAAAAACLERRTPAVERTGVCNTFWAQGGEVWGDNTDPAGAAAALDELLGSALRGARVLLLGAGGAAAAVLCALLDGEAGEVVVANRTRERAHALAWRCAPGDRRVRVLDEPRRAANERWELVVNATPLGLAPGDPHPFPPRPESAAAVLDTVYAPGGTRWVRAARSAGIPAADGTAMLVGQGAAAFERWWQRPAPRDVMRAAAERIP